ECGRTHKKIDRIQGRTDDMFIINGVNIWPSAIEAVLHSNPLVGNEYQIVALLRESGDKLIVRVESIKKLSEDEKALLEKKVRENLKEVVLVDPVVEVVDPSTLPRSEGKAQRIQVVREYT
ncbi:MAG: hypothetical protein QXH10_10090, partial [Ignisphaera sp.]